MKSNEEFIAGIYAKAKQCENESMTEPITITKTNAFQRNIKKYTTYAAGVAACIACGIVVSQRVKLKHNIQDNANVSQARYRGNDTIELNTLPEYLQCKVISSEKTDEVYHIQVKILNPKENQREDATLMAVSDLVNGWEKTGNEVVVQVYGPDSNNNYTVVANSDVYSYSQTIDGVKLYQSENQQVIKETDINK